MCNYDDTKKDNFYFNANPKQKIILCLMCFYDNMVEHTNNMKVCLEESKKYYDSKIK